MYFWRGAEIFTCPSPPLRSPAPALTPRLLRLISCDTDLGFGGNFPLAPSPASPHHPREVSLPSLNPLSPPRWTHTTRSLVPHDWVSTLIACLPKVPGRHAHALHPQFSPPGPSTPYNPAGELWEGVHIFPVMASIYITPSRTPGPQPASSHSNSRDLEISVLPLPK